MSKYGKFFRNLGYCPLPMVQAHPESGSLTMRTDKKLRPLTSGTPNRINQASIAPHIAHCLKISLGADEAARCAQHHHWDGVLTKVQAKTGHAGACG
jgi:hypothetical protein